MKIKIKYFYQNYILNINKDSWVTSLAEGKILLYCPYINYENARTIQNLFLIKMIKRQE